MKTKRLFWLLLVMTLIVFPIAAQTNAGTTIPGGVPVFAPFVSQLRLELQNNLLRVSWIDSPDARGTVYIYRSTSPFQRAVPRDGLRIAAISHGEQHHIDDVEPGETDKVLYYFVIASDEMGRVFDLPIIYSNTRSILIPAAGAVLAEIPPPPVVEEDVIPPGISSLQATVDGNRVLITFTQSPETSGAILYRSVHPIRHRADLSLAQIVREGISSPLTDYPIPGIPYFYAIILEDDIRRGTVEIILGQNTTAAPVEITALDPAGRRRIRPLPLPLLSIGGATSAPLGLHAAPPTPQELSPEAAKALGEIPIRAAPEADERSPRVFARDLESVHVVGEDFALSSIVTGPFAERNWEAARSELIGFLALPRTPDTEARARFYLGQSYYFMRMPREGLFEFLAIQDRHPAEAMSWIQASLNMLREQP